MLFILVIPFYPCSLDGKAASIKNQASLDWKGKWVQVRPGGSVLLFQSLMRTVIEKNDQKELQEKAN